jgi:hypothetical protein
MAYKPPHYAPRNDWKQKLPTGGPAPNSWQFDMLMYQEWVATGDLSTGFKKLTRDEAWTKLDMSKDNALKALAALPPRPTNDAGLVPPDIASRVFARSLAKVVDPGMDAAMVPEDPLPVTVDREVPSFTLPRYQPRPDWQSRLESMDPEVDSWQADVVHYWALRRGGKSEEAAWAEVGMSPANARMALVTEPPTPGNDSGLIPCIPDGPHKETVARRVLARSVARNIDAGDIYGALILEP